MSHKPFLMFSLSFFYLYIINEYAVAFHEKGK